MQNILSHKSIYTSLPYPGTIRNFQITDNGFLRFKVREDSYTMLACASVFGGKFSNEALRRLFEKSSAAGDFKHTLQNLKAREYFVSDENKLIEFSDEQVRQNVYAGLDSTVRETLHELSAEIIESSVLPGEAKPFDELIHHYNESGNTEKVTEILWRAAAYSVSVFDYPKAKEYYSGLLESVTDNDKKHKLILNIAEVYRNAGEWTEELNFLSKYLKQTHDPLKRTQILIRIANVHRLKSDYHTSQRILYRAGEIAKENGFEEEVQNISLEHAKINLNKGKHIEALKDFEAICSVSTGETHRWALTCKGITLAKLGRYDESITVHRALFEMAEAKRDKVKMLAASINIGEGFMFTGETDKAMESYLLGYRFAKRAKYIFDAATCKGGMGSIYYLRRNFIAAARNFFKQMQSYKTIGNRAGMATAIGSIGLCMINAGKYKKANEYLFDQLRLVRELKRKQSEALCLGNIGMVYSLLGDFNGAISYFKKQMSIAVKIGSRESVVWPILNIGIQYYVTRNFKKAERYIAKAIIMLTKMNMEINSEIALSYYSAVLFELKKYRMAEKTAISAIEAAQIHNNKLMFVQAQIIKEKCKLFTGFSKPAKCKEKILNLKNESLGDEEKAMIYYETWKICTKFFLGENTHRQLARNYYKELIKKSPQYEFKEKMRELN